MTREQLKCLLNPLYWPIWVLLAICWCSRWLPYRFLLWLGSLLGSMASRIPSYTRTVVQLNLRLCFPVLTAVQRQRLFTAVYRSLGMAFFETLLAWFGRKKTLSSLLHLHGAEHVEAAIRAGRGALVVVPHMVSLELVGRLVAQHYPMEAVYRPHRKPIFDWINRWHLSRTFKRAIPKHDVRGIVRALRNNHVVFLLPDIDPGRERSLFSPFFNIQAATLDSVSRIARMAKTQVLAAGPYRCVEKAGYDLYFHPAFDHFPSGDFQQDTNRINQAFERIVRQAPEQYLWTYRRFYTRPEGEASLYPSKRRRKR